MVGGSNYSQSLFYSFDLSFHRNSLMDEIAYFDADVGVYRFVDDLEGEDSGVEDLPFTSYLELDHSVNKVQGEVTTNSQNSDQITDLDDDDFVFVDDERDVDYKPSKSLWGVKKVYLFCLLYYLAPEKYYTMIANTHLIC